MSPKHGWVGPSELARLVVPLDGLRLDKQNARTHSERNLGAIRRSLELFGQQKPIVVNAKGTVVAGNGTVQAAKALGWTRLAVVRFKGTPVQAKAYAVADNRTAELAEWDPENLSAVLKELADEDYLWEDDLAFTQDELDALKADAAHGGGGSAAAAEGRTTLAERFGVPPFSILDARQGYWRERKRAWLAQGIQGELGRDCKVFGTEGNVAGDQSGTSIFDPVLCELAYRWFAPKGGLVVDPFAGGSVRGVVAAMLGYAYMGMDLSERQVQANIKQGKDILTAKQRDQVGWKRGDSRHEFGSICDPEGADLVFTCPPYFDLERYSEDHADLSNVDWDQFKDGIHKVAAESFRVLADDRFSVWVVGDVRDKKGAYRGLPMAVAYAHLKAGFTLHNEAVYVTPAGTLCVRVGRQFTANRKLGKSHQNVLVFVKGDAVKATKACGPTEFGVIEPDGEDAAQD